MGSASEYMRFWPLVVFVITLLGSTTGFYYKAEAVADDVEQIKQDFAKTNLVDLKFIIVENRVENLDDKVDENEDRTVQQLNDINGKLDEIQRLLLKRAEAD